MSVKYVFASHHKLAAGLKETCDFLTNHAVEIYNLSAYVDNNKNIQDEVKTLINSFSLKDSVVVLTDMMGGSVCQCFYPYISDRIHLLCGMNLPLALSLILSFTDSITSEDIRNTLKEAKSAMKYLNEYQFSASDEDE